MAGPESTYCLLHPDRQRIHQQNGVIRNKPAPCDPMKKVHTFSSLHMSAKLRTILAYGLDFNLPFYKLDFYRYFFPFEKLALRLSRDDHVPNTSELLPRLQTLVMKYFF